MRKTKRKLRHAALAAGWAALSVLTACGGGGAGVAGSETGGGSPAADYFPLAVGNRWLYQTDSGSRSTVDVVSSRSVTQGTALVLQTTDASGTSTELYLHSPGGVLLLPDTSADPISAAVGALQILRFPITAGDRWVIVDKSLTAVADLDGDGRPETLAIHAEATVIGFESVFTPAGTYAQAARVQTVLTQAAALSSNSQRVSATTTSDDWYAPDLGLVRNVTATTGPSGQSSVTTSTTGWRVGSQRSESVAPTVISKSPAAESTSGGCCAALSVQFSEAINQTGPDSSGIHLIGPDGKDVAGKVVWQNLTTASFAPATTLVSGTYIARITTSAKDLVGNALAAPLEWQFTVDAAAPGITPLQPPAGSAEAPLDGRITFSLDEDPDPASVRAGSVTLSDGSSFLDIDVALSGRIVTLTPRAPLRSAVTYIVNATGITDKYGNRASASWTFSSDPGRFAAPVALISSAPVTATATGDVDGDGRTDVLMATGYNFGTPDDFTLFVFRQQANGTFAAPQRYSTHAGYGGEIRSLAVIDIDGQGRNAVVAGNQGHAIEIFRRQPDASLASSQLIATPASYVVRVADIDGDGRLDLVGRPYIGSAVQIWYQSASGGFGPPVSVPVIVGGGGSMAVGDISGDGRRDIVVTSGQGFAGQEIAVVRQQPGGNFAPATYGGVPEAFGAQEVEIGDLNGDGRADVVVALPGSSGLGLFLQDASGALSALTVVRSTSSISSIALADVDGDGRLDVVAGAWGGFPLALHRQRTNGSLGAAETFALKTYGGPGPGLLSVADVNGDGRPDILYSDTWLRQRAVPTTPPPVAASAGRTASRLGIGRLPGASAH